MRYTLLVLMLAIGYGVAAQDPVPEPFKRSDPALLSATGRPQLVEFYHPT